MGVGSQKLQPLLRSANTQEWSGCAFTAEPVSTMLFQWLSHRNVFLTQPAASASVGRTVEMNGLFDNDNATETCQGNLDPRHILCLLTTHCTVFSSYAYILNRCGVSVTIYGLWLFWWSHMVSMPVYGSAIIHYFDRVRFSKSAIIIHFYNLIGSFRIWLRTFESRHAGSWTTGLLNLNE